MYSGKTALRIMILSTVAVILSGCGGAQSGQPGPGTAETFGTETVDFFEDRQNPYAGSMYDLLAEEDVEENGSVPLAEQDCHNRVNVPRDGVDAFLSQVGLSRQDKFHEYRWHNESSHTIAWSHSDVVLTLYFDPERELGCGYLDYPEETFTDMDGFMFKGCIEIDCKETDPYGVFALYEGDSMDEIYLGNLPPEKLPDAYEYESLYVCEYDGERLMRIWMYGTGSDTERFFIYDGDSDMPSYCLNLVDGVTHGATLFKFVY